MAKRKSLGVEYHRPLAKPEPYTLPTGGTPPPIVELILLWKRFSDLSIKLERRDFLGKATTYFSSPVEGDDIPLTGNHPKIVAGANYGYVCERLGELLDKIALETTPTPAILRCQIENAMGGVPLDGLNTVSYWNERRRLAVARLDPAISMFVASCRAARETRKPRKPRNDEPTPTDVENVRKVMGGMSAKNSSVTEIRKAVKRAGYSLSNAKVSAAIKKIRE